MEKRLHKNIRLYGFLKIFTKRVFLPLTTIYLATIGGLTIPQIGILATISATASLVFEVPTGFFADRMTRKTSIIIAGILAAIGTLFYAFTPFFAGAIVAVLFESLAYAFLNGPGEALMHDTLVALKRDEDYAKVVGRSQSVGLIGNTFLVAIIPLTYKINPRLPFLLGTVAFLALIFIATQMFEPPRSKEVEKELSLRHALFSNLRKFVTTSSILLFISLGIIGGLYTVSGDFTNLVFKDQNMTPSLLGLVYAGASVLAVIGGFFVHILRNQKLRTYAVLDIIVFGGTSLLIGIGHNLPATIIAFMLSMSWWRLRSILYQHHLLKVFKNNTYKATLLSVYSFFIRANEIWLPFVFVFATLHYGYYRAFNWIGALSMAVLIPLVIVAINIFTRSQLAREQTQIT